MLQANQPITNHFLSSLISVTHNTMDLVPEISIFTNITAISFIIGVNHILMSLQIPCHFCFIITNKVQLSTATMFDQ